MILKNGKRVSALYHGDQAISRVYHGEDLVWSGINLPPGYTKVEYVRNDSSTKVLTGIIPEEGMRLKIRYYCALGRSSNYIFQSRRNASTSNFYGMAGSLTGNTISFAVPGAAVVSEISRTTGHIYSLDGWAGGKTISLNVTDETTGASDYQQGTYTDWAPTTTPLGIFGSANYITAGTRVYSASIYIGSQKVADFIPCVDPDGAAGFYDIVRKEFYGAYSGALYAP